ETLARMLVPAGCGLAAIVQADPSQLATSGLFAAAARCAPTATHADGEMQATDANPEMNERLGLGRSDQPPSRRSTSVRLPWPWKCPPTATHQSVDVQAMPVRLLKTVVVGLCSSCQRLPSNDSATVETAGPFECWPTETQNE